MDSFNSTINKKTFLASLFAITVNAILLKIAPIFHIRAESGGLLKLVFSVLPNAINKVKFLHTFTFWLAFHYLTGFVMAAVYLLFFRNQAGIAWKKGCLFSFLPWLINGLIVLPLLAQGIMGIYELPILGITWFFFANATFAILLALLVKE